MAHLGNPEKLVFSGSWVALFKVGLGIRVERIHQGVGGSGSITLCQLASHAPRDISQVSCVYIADILRVYLDARA